MHYYIFYILYMYIQCRHCLNDNNNILCLNISRMPLREYYNNSVCEVACVCTGVCVDVCMCTYMYVHMYACVCMCVNVYVSCVCACV